MTQQQAIDMVRQAHPSASETEILVRLNGAIRELCSESLVYHDTVTLPVSDPGDGTSYVDGTTTAFVLDPDIFIIDRVTIGIYTVPYNTFPTEETLGEPTTGANRPKVWRFEGGKFHIGYQGTRALAALDAATVVTLYVQRVPDAVNTTLTLYDSASNATLTDTGQPIDVANATLSDNVPLPAVFHNCLVSRVIEQLFALRGEHDQVRYYFAVWREGVRHAKRHVGRQKRGSFNVHIHEF